MTETQRAPEILRPYAREAETVPATITREDAARIAKACEDKLAALRKVRRKRGDAWKAERGHWYRLGKLGAIVGLQRMTASRGSIRAWIDAEAPRPMPGDAIPATVYSATATIARNLQGCALKLESPEASASVPLAFEHVPAVGRLFGIDTGPITNATPSQEREPMTNENNRKNAVMLKAPRKAKAKASRKAKAKAKAPSRLPRKPTTYVNTGGVFKSPAQLRAQDEAEAKARAEASPWEIRDQEHTKKGYTMSLVVPEILQGSLAHADGGGQASGGLVFPRLYGHSGGLGLQGPRSCLQGPGIRRMGRFCFIGL